MRFETVIAFRSTFPRRNRAKSKVSNRGRPDGTSIQSSERLSDVVADRPPRQGARRTQSANVRLQMYFNSRHRPPALQAWRLGMRPWHTRTDEKRPGAWQ